MKKWCLSVIIFLSMFPIYPMRVPGRRSHAGCHYAGGPRHRIEVTADQVVGPGVSIEIDGHTYNKKKILYKVFTKLAHCKRRNKKLKRSNKNLSTLVRKFMVMNGMADARLNEDGIMEWKDKGGNWFK